MSVLDDEINERWIIKDNKLKKWILNLFKIILYIIIKKKKEWFSYNKHFFVHYFHYLHYHYLHNENIYQ